MRITRGQAAAFKHDRLGHGNLDDVERLSILITSGLQAAKILAQWLVIHIFRGGFDPGDAVDRSHEASEVVDVAMSVVAEDSAAKPDYMRCPQIISEDLLIAGAAHPRI